MALNICFQCLLPMAYHTSAGCPVRKTTWIVCGVCGRSYDEIGPKHICPVAPSTSTNPKPFWTLYS